MKAVVFDGEVKLVRRKTPVPRKGEALIKVELAGICNTDLEIVKGYMGFKGVLGHEFVGRVEEATDRSWIGRRVTGEINLPCGACEWCRRGLGRHCPKRTVLGIQGRDGCFAERLALPLANLHVVPDDLPDEAAVFTEPVAAACEILEQVPLNGGERALVLGDGKLGNLCAQVLATAGADVLLAGRHEEKLEAAAEAGIETALSTKLSRRKPFDLVVEATGRPEGLSLALERVRPRGVIVLKTTAADPASFNLAPLVIHEITLVGSRCGPFAPALALLAEGKVDPRPLVSAVIPLEEGVEALRMAAEEGIMKVLLDCS